MSKTICDDGCGATETATEKAIRLVAWAIAGNIGDTIREAGGAAGKSLGDCGPEDYRLADWDDAEDALAQHEPDATELLAGRLGRDHAAFNNWRSTWRQIKAATGLL